MFCVQGEGVAHHNDPVFITLGPISSQTILPLAHFLPLKDSAVNWVRFWPLCVLWSHWIYN